jgi:hypothetical protein
MADYTKEVQQLYVAYFSRPADPDGLAFWSERLATEAAGYADISFAFSTSVEYRAAYVYMDTRSMVNEVYENLFSRPGDAAGVDFWVKALNMRYMTIDDMVLRMIDGAQGADAVAYQAKVAVATAFTERVDTPQEIALYSGEVANEIAAAYIGGVNDEATALVASDPVNIDATIANMGPASGAMQQIGLVGVVEAMPA